MIIYKGYPIEEAEANGRLYLRWTNGEIIVADRVDLHQSSRDDALRWIKMHVDLSIK